MLGEWFPEVARILSLQGAEILFYPSAIGSEPDHPEISTRSSWERQFLLTAFLMVYLLLRQIEWARKRI